MRKKVRKTLAALATAVGMLATSMVAFAAENYTVEKDDYLKKIAKQTYGDEEKWEVIYEANKEQIKNPNLIYAGQVLTIPDLDNSTAESADITESVATAIPKVETPVPTQAPATEAPTPTPAAETPTSSPVEEPASVAPTSTGSMSADDANIYVAMLYSSLTTQLPDSVLSFFDVDGNMTIDSSENDDCFFWLIDSYNPQKKTSLSLLSNEEKIAIATAMNNGGVKAPAELFHTTR